MAYLTTILYSVFLGTITRNLVLVKEDQSTQSITIRNLITTTNRVRILPILLMFLVDWIIFLLIFGSSNQFTLEIYDISLLVFYFPAITFLTIALLNSIEESSTNFCYHLSYYHFIAGVSEVVWIIWKLSSYKGTEADVTSMIPIIIIIALYIIIRFGLGAFFYISGNTTLRINSTLVNYLSLIVKPALLIFLTNLTFLSNIF